MIQVPLIFASWANTNGLMAYSIARELIGDKIDEIIQERKFKNP